jgi:hypothetical protein
VKIEIRFQTADIVTKSLLTDVFEDNGMHSNKVPNSLLEACLVLCNQGMVYKDCIPHHDMWKPQGAWEKCMYNMKQFTAWLPTQAAILVPTQAAILCITVEQWATMLPNSNMDRMGEPILCFNVLLVPSIHLMDSVLTFVLSHLTANKLF